jgi:hypothetical protein
MPILRETKTGQSNTYMDKHCKSHARQWQKFIFDIPSCSIYSSIVQLYEYQAVSSPAADNPFAGQRCNCWSSAMLLPSKAVAHRCYGSSIDFWNDNSVFRGSTKASEWNSNPSLSLFYILVVSWNGTSKSSILVGLSLFLVHPIWDIPISGTPRMMISWWSRLPGRRMDWAPPWNLQRQSCSWHCHRTLYDDALVSQRNGKTLPSLTISWWSNMFPNLYLEPGSGKRLKNHGSLSLHPPSCGPLFGYVCHVFKTFRFKSPAQRSTVG